MPDLTPQEFVEKWAASNLKESASVQSHFNDVCRMLGQKTPTEADPDGEFFTFEYGLTKSGGGHGRADVWKKGHFAIEYKGKRKHQNLDAAYQQLLQYREALQNPPLLIVCDIENWEIHTNWPNTQKKVTKFTNADIARPEIQKILRALFENPEQLHPRRTTEQVTIEAATIFKDIADEMRDQVPAERLARFLTRLIFCLFAEDVGLLPAGLSGDGVFTEIVKNTRMAPDLFLQYTAELFRVMADGGHIQFKEIRWFDGTLFDDVAVERLSLKALEGLAKACALNWSAVEPAIFGTLFERVIDPAKRAQLGLHYTSRQDIELIVEPVLMEPLRREWAAIQADAAPLRAQYDAAATPREKHTLAAQLRALRDRMLARLRDMTVLDPACGSGNFLYVALQLLKNLEKEVITHPLWHNGDLDGATPQVHPRQLFGIEINEIAHDLASIVVWIGYLQWNITNGFFDFSSPVLEPLDNMQLMDAILAFDADGNPVEPEWPVVDIIVGNPPFLGGQKMRAELGDQYVETLRGLYGDRLPGQSDLVTYWFEQARSKIEQGKAKRAGLLATNTIRQTINRTVLERIKATGDIFMAWSDREWILEGAAVRISMVGFDNGSETEHILDGVPVTHINADLQNTVDTTKAKSLPENIGLAFMGDTSGGPFDIPAELAQEMLEATNPDNRPNSDVVRPWFKASDITGRPQNLWIIDFGVDTSIEQARAYEKPFQYVEKHVLTKRQETQREEYRQRWWLHVRPRPDLRDALVRLDRFIVTPLVSKHRVFVWLAPAIPDARLIAVARSDDYFFGVLHSKIHEVWALRKGARHGVGNDPTYNVTECFLTFPFPWTPGAEPTDHPAHAAISAAAKTLHEERDAWLNPPGVTSPSALKRRTLTNLYNALALLHEDPDDERARMHEFAPRLATLHRALDEAVCDAYGWPHDVLDNEEEILRRMLALNLARAAEHDA